MLNVKPLILPFFSVKLMGDTMSSPTGTVKAEDIMVPPKGCPMHQDVIKSEKDTPVLQ